MGIVYEVLPNGTFTFIHASCKYGVTITEGNKNYYHTRFVTAKRILEKHEDKDDRVSIPSVETEKVL